MAEVADDIYAAAVEQSFRDNAIRTAVLIDDQFPDYLQSFDPDPKKFREADRARSIYSYIHGRGLICDIVNWQGDADKRLESIDKARKSDLVILDYKLEGDSASAALQILRRLANTDHFNLVALYTADKVADVALAVAAAMRGVPQSDPRNALSVEEELASQAFLEDPETRSVDGPALQAWLRDGDFPAAWKKLLVERLKAAELNPGLMRKLLPEMLRRWLGDISPGYEHEAEPILSLRSGESDAANVWVQCGSCFVTVIRKVPSSADVDEGEYIWNKLGAALREWHPNLYRLLLSDIQNALEQESIADHERWLADDLCVGLGLYLLPTEESAVAGHGDSDRGSVESLIDRFVDMIRQRLSLHGRIAATGTELLRERLGVAPQRQPEESVRHARARQLAHLPDNVVPDWRNGVARSVNAFMVSDLYRGSHVTTGSVLFDADAGKYWLCASPACDLVPRGDDQSRIMQVLQLLEDPETASLTHGDRIVVTTRDGAKVLRVLDATKRQPTLREIYLPEGTTTSVDEENDLPFVTGLAGDRLHLLVAAASEVSSQGGPATDAEGPPQPRDGVPGSADVTTGSQDGATTGQEEMEEPQACDPAARAAFELTRYHVVSQLRSSFALRLLHVTGHHLSRIGVDFVDV